METLITEMPIHTSMIQLPSQGKLYPVNSPLSSGEIEIKHMTAMEEDILSSMTLIKRGIVLDKLLEACIIDKNIDTNEMLICDRNAVFIAIRVSGFGKHYPIQTNCPNCKMDTKGSTDLSELNVKFLETNPISANINLFRYNTKYENIDYEFTFKFLTGGDEIRITEIQKRLKQNNPEGNEQDVTLRMIEMIDQLNEHTLPEALQLIIPNLPRKLSKKFRNYVDEIEPKIELKTNVICSNCSVDSEVDVPMTSDFFWPKS